MVFKKVFVFTVGVGIASFPIHYEMNDSVKNESKEIREAFKK
jgi:hypothetical protein